MRRNSSRVVLSVRLFLAAGVAVASVFFATGTAATQPLSDSPTLVLNPDRGVQGSTFNVSGSGHSCGLLPTPIPENELIPVVGQLLAPPSISITWQEGDATRELERVPAHNGSFTTDVVVPPDATLGPHVVRTACDDTGDVTLASATFTVLPPPPVHQVVLPTPGASGNLLPQQLAGPEPTTARPTPARLTTAAPPATAAAGTPPTPRVEGRELVREPPEDARRQRSRFPASLRRPTEVSGDPSLLATNALLAALFVLLVAFPAELFNSTFEANYEEIQGWFSATRARLQEAGQWLRELPRGVAFGAFSLVGSVLYSLLDPEVGLDGASLALVFGLLATLVVTTSISELVKKKYADVVATVQGYIRVLPAALLIGACSVLLSRLVEFQPGYLYGVIAGLVIVRGSLSEEQEAKAICLSTLCLVAVCLLAWVAWMPIDAAAEEPGPGFATLVADSALAGIFVSGLEGLVVGLVPLRFLDGERVVAWNRLAWGGVYFLIVFGFLQVLLHPTEAGYAATAERDSLGVGVFLLVAFGLLSVTFWAWFRFRSRPSVPATVSGAP